MKMLDLFSGIGGFHKGFEQAGFEFDWVGFSEIDKYATAVYKHKFKDTEELGDITAIQPERDLPNNIDIICGGFPCQAFSVSGYRKGFEDSRGTLFFEIARILGHYRDIGQPIPCFLLENVKGLLNHDNGRTFATIYRILSDLGYTIEFQLINTKWWLPQNRERIYIVGYIGRGGRPKVFPFTESDRSDGGAQETERGSREGLRSQDYSTALRAKESRSGCDTLINEGLNQIGTIGKDSEATRVYDTDGISRTIKNGGGMGAKTGLYRIPEATNKGYAEADIGDSINLSALRSKTRRGRVGKGEANTLDTAMEQYTIVPKGVASRTRSYKGKLSTIEERSDNLSNAINSAPKDSMVKLNTRIRRLTPTECCRLQGFPDDWNSYGEIDGEVVEMSDTQRYKQVGNAVTVDVVQAIAERIRPLFEDNERV